MSVFGHFFADDATRAEELARDAPLLKNSLQRYFDSFREKDEQLDALQKGWDLHKIISLLKRALADEIAAIQSSERTTEEIVSDLDVTAHHQRLKELENLRLTLDNAATQERYAYKLMRQLYGILLDEAHILQALERDGKDATLIKGFTTLLEQEKKIVLALRGIPDLETLYKNLALGTRRKHELDEHEREASEEIYERMMDTRTLENCKMEATAQHDISELTAWVFNNLDIVVMSAVAGGVLLQRDHMIFEYVNSDLFERFVLREAREDFPNLTNQELKIFIHIFRDLYNTRIEQDMY